ncbi:TPA: DUF1934 domain-containing protein [Staphylococcus aureus]|uniref:Uncharacterized beta-barrel protein ywiB n=1 Tax=Staphylococcus aureus TaxID=1280 RepID=A0A7I8NLT8_STAAU|nr:DUF1934 domain-containing protein [Staphylococcus aureus]HDH6211884.1 DUF1934 domain-containing protein [Staphylococcus aureus LTCF-12-55]HDH6226389.1 DUF1934 domain-containing protein [Staphylococcus aureus LTCF-12-46]HDH6264778.1 DUF1934 domain-containing protein [Staphylococcus aureus LTCF-7-30]HDH6421256.1 DUF1934 domain-containing protein [Staphylococcus aureus MRSA-Lux-33]HDH6423605.1 DUF1934 domain-containing protein [Staphylococcus aureus MRSA-Lux-34]HDH6426361.1 DUF1934 domain-con
MDKKVSIYTKQVLKQHNEKEKFEFTTEGTWQQRQSNFIRYVEQIEDATVNVTIKVDDDSVKLIRKGDINMNLHFVEGQATTTFYDISAGRIPLEVKTLRILHFVSGDGGKLKIHYELYQDNEKMGSYQYEINYKEIGE